MKKYDGKCLICNSEMKYYFSKEYIYVPYASFMKDIGKVEYYKCNNCGFVFSKTHSELTSNVWEKLNHDVHHYLELNESKYYSSFPVCNADIRRGGMGSINRHIWNRSQC